MLTRRFRVTTLCLGLLSPVFVHAIVIAMGAGEDVLSQYMWIDWAVNAVTMVYVLVLVGVLLSRRGLPQFTLLTWSALLGLAGTEATLRFLYPAPPPNIPKAPMSFAADVGDALPGCRGIVRFSVNDMGLRGPRAKPERFDHRFLCVGGSTTECRYVTDEESWPWRFQNKLAEELGESVFVGNAGLSGTGAIHHGYLIRNYEPVSKFDWVIVMCGINDAGFHDPEAGGEPDRYERIVADVHSGRLTSLTPVFGHDPPSALYYRRLALVRTLYRMSNRPRGVVQDPRGNWIIEERAVRKRALARNTVSEPPDAERMEVGLNRYRDDLRGVIRACRERGVNLLMLTQPTLYDENLPPELEDLLYARHYHERAAYTPGALEAVIESLNRVMREVCREEEIDCIDLSSMLPKDTTVFYTECHFNISGCEKVATILTEYFREKLRGEAAETPKSAAPMALEIPDIRVVPTVRTVSDGID